MPAHKKSNQASIASYSGFYYPPYSVKTRPCLRGRNLLYEHCDKYAIPCRKTGKLVVGHSHQREYLENLHHKGQCLSCPSVYGATVPGPDLSTVALRPNSSPATRLAVWSPTSRQASHSLHLAWRPVSSIHTPLWNHSRRNPAPAPQFTPRALYE